MSDYKLKVSGEGDCEVILPAGQDFVRTIKSEGECKALLELAKSIEPSDRFDGFVKVNDGEIYIAVEPEKAKAKAEKPADEEKSEPKKKASTKKKA